MARRSGARCWSCCGARARPGRRSRAGAGYGAHSTIHTASILELSSDLPLVVEWVDTPERVEQLLPRIEEMLQGGLITTDPVRIIRYQPHLDHGRAS